MARQSIEVLAKHREIPLYIKYPIFNSNFGKKPKAFGVFIGFCPNLVYSIPIGLSKI